MQSFNAVKHRSEMKTPRQNPQLLWDATCFLGSGPRAQPLQPLNVTSGFDLSCSSVWSPAVPMDTYRNWEESTRRLLSKLLNICGRGTIPARDTGFLIPLFGKWRPDRCTVRRKCHGYPTTSASATGRLGGRISFNQLRVADFTGGLVENGQQILPLPSAQPLTVCAAWGDTGTLVRAGGFSGSLSPSLSLAACSRNWVFARSFAQVAKFRIDA